MLAVCHAELAPKTLLLEVGLGELDRRPGEVDARHCRAPLREPRQVDPRAAADLKNRPAATLVEVYEAQQMVELLEMILIEIVEEPARADRMAGDLEIVNMPLPVVADLVRGRHDG